MRLIACVLAGLLCLVFTACPQSDTGGSEQPPTSTDNGGGDEWDE